MCIRDRSCDINNYLHLAKTASEANNGQETYDYANKVLELDSTNAEAVSYTHLECLFDAFQKFELCLRFIQFTDNSRSRL